MQCRDFRFVAGHIPRLQALQLNNRLAPSCKHHVLQLAGKGKVSINNKCMVP